MPVFLLIGIPIAVAILLYGILTLPDDEPNSEGTEVKLENKPKTSAKKKKK